MYSANAGKSVFGVLVLGFLFFASGVENIAQAQQIFYAALDGAQETPANVSPATGTGTVVLNAAETQITVSLEFSALGSAQTAAHIHSPAARGVAAGVIIGLPNGTFINQTFAVTAGQVADLKAGLWYFNVHTVNFGGGEIRGQIEPPLKRFSARLDAVQETPPNASPATGSGTVTLNAAETQITVSLQFSGLTGAQTAAHLHKGVRTVAGPVEIAIPNGTFINQTFAITPTQVADLKAGLLYFNVHTTTFGGGEIRGQIEPDCTSASVGLVSWWTADGNAFDSRSRFNGTLQNGATFGAGQNGQGFSLDGINDYVRITTASALNPTGSFSLEAWIYPTADVAGDIISKWGDTAPWTNQRAYILNTDTNRRVNFQMSDNANQANPAFHNFYTPNNAITLNTWNHVAGVYDQPTGQRRIYVNGVLVATRTDAPTTVTSSIADLTLGATLFSPSAICCTFPGNIDEPAIYNRALSTSEIAAIFNAGISAKCKPTATTAPTNQVLWLAGDGNTNDISGNSNNGTLQNGAGFAVGNVGQGFSFDGVDDYVSIPDSTSLRPVTAVTVEGWFKFASTSGTQILVAKTVGTGTSESFVLFYSGGNIFGTVGGVGGTGVFISLPFSPTVGTWYHISYTFNDSTDTQAIYVNGSGTSGTQTASMGYDSHPVTIGTEFENEILSFFFNGSADEVSIYNRALTASEINSIFAAGTAGKLKTVNTPIGFSVTDLNKSEFAFSPQVVNTNVGDATITFQSVTTAGTTQQIPLELTDIPPLPTGATANLQYDISTTAIYTGSPTVCFNLPSFTVSQFANLRIYHLENGAWVNRTGTTTFPNLCTTGLSSLSPFAIAGLAPLAATVSVSGRVTTVSGNGIGRARVQLTDQSGITRTILTNAFGYYRFEDVAVGETYTINASHKRYQFAPQAISVTEELNEVNITASP